MRPVARALPIACLLLVPGILAAGGDEPEFTDAFRVSDCRFSDRGGNAWFLALEPGNQLVLEGEDDGETIHLEITVLRNREWVTFETEEGETISVRARVIEEREWIDDELVEVSRNFFARCRQTGDVYYFGEEVDIYEDGEIASHAGAWRAGRDGALPGIIMPGTWLLGSRYYQEIAPGVALDRAEHVAAGIEIDLPAGHFEDCVEVVETTPLEPGAESAKIYCPGIGLVVDDEAELVEFSIDDGDDDGDDDHDDRRRARLERED